MSNMSYFSICVPTFNRANSLKQCFDHLLNFVDQRFELVVGNNASIDGTSDVIEEYRSKFKQFKTVRHDENLGFSRNVDSILRLAINPYVYILSDDDYVFEDVFDLVVGAFQSNPEVVAVAGKYMGVRELNASFKISYSSATAVVLPKFGFQALLDNYLLCDGHPFIRRDIFQRHCSYRDRTIGLFPLFMRLLCFGSILVVDKPFIQHAANKNSLSGNMTEAWMIDMANADFELALSMPLAWEVRPNLRAAREGFLQLMYFQAGRMALSRREFSLFWLFMRRLRGVQGGSDSLFLQVEHRFIHDFLVNRVVEIIADSGLHELVVVDSDVCSAISIDACRRLSGLVVKSHNENSFGLDNQIYLCENYPITPTVGAVVISLTDLFDQLRLTKSPSALAIINGRVVPDFGEGQAHQWIHEEDQSFRTLCTDYSGQ